MTEITTISTVMASMTLTIEMRVMIETKVRFGWRERSARKRLNGSFTGYLLTACAFKSSRSTNSSTEEWVASRSIGAARPFSSAAFQRVTQTHQRSPGLSPGKPHSGIRRHEIVPIEHREIEKFFGYLHANGVKADVFRSGPAVSVTRTSGQRIATTAFEIRAEDIGRHGGQ